jgi:flavin-dependent dehydrogenase
MMKNADIIIIGSGFAGLSAAIESAQAGASVVVLEKMMAPGGIL